jgi:hypothetical protein
MPPTDPHNDGSRALQDRFDSRRLADRAAEIFSFQADEPVIDAATRTFVERMAWAYIATADAEGQPHCTYKGADPGFVRAVDDRTLVLLNYDGNGFYDLTQIPGCPGLADGALSSIAYQGGAPRPGAGIVRLTASPRGSPPPPEAAPSAG